MARSFRLDIKSASSADIALLGIIVFTFGPLLLAALAGWVAHLFGQRLNASDAPDIPVIGDLLYASLMLWMIWSMTIAPFGFLALCIAFPMWLISKVAIAWAPRTLPTATPSQSRSEQSDLPPGTP